MNTAQKVREHREKHPEFYCKVKGCLWRTFEPRTGRETPCGKHAPARLTTGSILGRPFSVMLADAKALEEATDTAAAQQALADIKRAMKYPSLTRSLRHREEDA